jgi:hypothetical protein
MDSNQVSLLTRSEIWAQDLKEIIKDELDGQRYVRWLTEFPDGTTFTIPSIGDATIRDYNENSPVAYDSMDTGEFQFSITEYVSSGNYITMKARQDAFYAAELEASFVPKQARALAEKLETDIFDLAGAGAAGGQTVSDLNNINGAPHRFVASGSSAAMAVADFAKALYSLKRANMADSNLIAIVDPSVEYTMNTLTNLTNMSYNPRWEGIVESGLASGMRFIRNIYGFDVYTSNYLAGAGADRAGAETINSVAATAGKCNVFFSAADMRNLPFIGAWRQMPKVDAEFNKDYQREEYVTTARYGLKVYRPENLVVVISDSDVV